MVRILTLAIVTSIVGPVCYNGGGANCAFGTEEKGTDSPQRRPAESEESLRAWLESMVWYHRFSADEMCDVTGLSRDQLRAAFDTWNLHTHTRPQRSGNEPILVLPYPGGRHPRIGFLDGAIDPQRDTKVSVFCPWDLGNYVVLDVPEAIWSNLGLTYLAHTHIDTVWSKQGIELARQEWQRDEKGWLVSRRQLPNGIRFATVVRPTRTAVRMEMWLYNGTSERLTDLRVQQCAMLKEADGFNQQTKENKIYSGPYATCHDASRKRWLIHAWDPVHRTWGNPPCPCLHSDPKFPDCAPGETQTVRGWFSFFEGDDIDEELKRIEATGWRQETLGLSANDVLPQ